MYETENLTTVYLPSSINKLHLKGSSVKNLYFPIYPQDLYKLENSYDGTVHTLKLTEKEMNLLKSKGIRNIEEDMPSSIVGE